MQNQTDHTMFYKHSGDKKISILILYVDDIILIGDNIMELEKLKGALAKELGVKDIGQFKYFLDMKVARSWGGIFVSQQKYTLDLLKETRMLGCKLANTPIDPNRKLGQTELSSSVYKGHYQRLMGKLIYLSYTHLDIAFVVSMIN